MNMLQLLEFLAQQEKGIITKKQFGEIMHGNSTEEEKKQALEIVRMAGGYEGLL